MVKYFVKNPISFSLCSCWPTSPPSWAPHHLHCSQHHCPWFWACAVAQPSLSLISRLWFPLIVLHFFPRFMFFLFAHIRSDSLSAKVSHSSPSSRSSAAFVCFWFDFSLWLLVERMWCADGTVDWFARDFNSSFVPQWFWWWERVVSRPVSFFLFLIFLCSRSVPAQSQPLHCRQSLQGLFLIECARNKCMSVAWISVKCWKMLNVFSSPLCFGSDSFPPLLYCFVAYSRAQNLKFCIGLFCFCLSFCLMCCFSILSVSADIETIGEILLKIIPTLEEVSIWNECTKTIRFSRRACWKCMCWFALVLQCFLFERFNSISTIAALTLTASCVCWFIRVWPEALLESKVPRLRNWGRWAQR